MPLDPGRSIGHYKIIAAIGAGGMGEVYRATDTRLGRDVALKVLPAQVVNDPERLARFRREAHLLASLNHPNVAAIYGLEEADGKPFLALELVEGEDLAARLTRGPVRLDEAMDVARQIAEGLEAAHEKGIVHRDLKPANIKVTPEGKVKILDFGLAKAGEGESADRGRADDLSRSPTLTRMTGTQTGVILGTAAYMSPEQARGRAVDKRADIWAFGVVIHEMLTGKRLFGGETVSDVLAAVLTRAVDLDFLPRGTPSALRRLLARCLERDPKRRLRDIGEARFVIEETIAGTPGQEFAPEMAGAAGPRSRQSGRRTIVTGAVLVLALGLSMITGWMLGERTGPDRAAPGPASPVRFSLDPPPEVDAIWAPAMAADGRLVVYAGFANGKTGLFVHRFDELEPRLLNGTEGASGPFLSPDGQWVGFLQGSVIKKMPVSGGDVLAICKMSGGEFPGAVWRPDGTILFARSWLSGLWTVSAEGGEPRPVTEPDRAKGEKGHWWPKLLPDGRHALFTVWMAKSGMNDSLVGLLDLESGRYRTLFPGADARFLPPGRIVYYRAGAYHAIPFDPVALAVSGEPVPVLDAASDLHPAGNGYMPLAVASNGTLIHTTSEILPESRLAWVAPGREPEYLPFPARRYVDIDLSPDGMTVAAASLEAGSFVVRLLDLRRGTDQRLDLAGSNWKPIWDPSGAGLAYQAMRKGDFDIYRFDVAGGGQEQPLLTDDGDDEPHAWSRDGRQLIHTTTEADGLAQIRTIAIDGGAGARVLGSGRILAADVSRDGAWLAISNNRSGRSEVDVQPFPGPGPTTRISGEGGNAPRWSADGNGIFFIQGDAVVGLSFRIEGGRFVPRDERIVLRAPLASRDDFDVSPDGRRFLVLLRADDPEPPRLRVVLNWDREIARLPLRP